MKDSEFYLNFEAINKIRKNLIIFFILNIFINIALSIFENAFIGSFLYLFTIFVFINFNKTNIKYYFFISLPEVLAFSLIFMTYLNFTVGLYLNFFLGIDFNFFLINSVYTDLGSYFYANIYLNFFSLFIIIFSYVFKINLTSSIFNKLEINLNFFIYHKILILLIFLNLIVLFYFYFQIITNPFNNNKFNIDDIDGYNYIISIYFLIIFFILILNQIIFNNFKKGIFSIIILSSSFLLNAVSFFIISRRYFLTFIFLNIVIYYIFNKNKFYLFKVLKIAFIGLFITYFASLYFFKFRTISYDSITNNYSLLDIYKIDKEYENKNFIKPFIENVSTRIVNNTELASLIYFDKIETNEKLHGELLINQILISIPSFFIADKNKYIIAEQKISEITKSPLFFNDTFDSLQSFSYADFGYLGLVIYPLIIILIIKLIYQILRLKILNKICSLFFITTLLSTFSITSVEINLVDYISNIRNFIIFLPFFLLLEKFISKKIH